MLETQRVGGFARFAYGNGCSSFPAGGKGVRKQDQLRWRENVAKLKGGDV